MAQSLRRPLLSVVGLSPSLGRRCFSQIGPLLGPQMAQGQQSLRPAQQADRSIRILSKEVGDVPLDIGLLDGTFVTPTKKNIPSLFDSPLSLFKLRWSHFKLRMRDRFSLLIIKFASPKEKSFFNRNIKIYRSQVAPTAIALHRQMYSSFAEGDSRALWRICTDGIYESFKSRIADRPRGEKLHWDLVKYNKRAKLVSHRAARLPIDGAAIMQAVVRICSTQRLTRYGANGTIVPGSGKEKDVVEYVVLQKRIINWKEGEWHIWGTTVETTLEDVQEWEMRIYS